MTTMRSNDDNEQGPDIYDDEKENENNSYRYKGRSAITMRKTMKRKCMTTMRTTMRTTVKRTMTVYANNEDYNEKNDDSVCQQ